MTDKMRAEFEAWYATLPIEDYCKWSAWSGWQSSRAAINVKLPELLADAPTPSLDYHDVLQALDTAGVGYE